MLRRSHRSRRLLCELLAAARVRAGLTQRELAARLGVTPSTIARIEQGERRLDVAELVVYARACGASPVEIVKRLAAVGGVNAVDRSSSTCAKGSRRARRRP